MAEKSKEKASSSSTPGAAKHGRLAGDVIIRRERPVRLRRALGVPGLFSAAYGDVGSSIYYALGVVALSALGLTPVVLMISGVFFLFTGLTYAEGAAAMPEAGGSGAFSRRAFNDLVSFIASWVLMMDYIVTISISAFTAAHYMGYFLPALRSWPASSLAGIGIVGGLVFVNILGVRQSARLNIVLVSMDIVTEVAIALLGVFLIISIPTIIHNIHWGVAPTTSQLLFGISISMVAYTGIETVANLGSEAKDPGRNIPRAVMLVFFVVIALYALLSMTALSAYPTYQGPNGNWVTNLTVEHLDDPILGLVHAMPHAIQPILGCWVAILAVTILIVASNAGLMGVSRLAYFMGRRQQLPSFISEINPKSRVPRNAIIIFSIIAIVLIGAGRLTFLADLYAFGAMLAYTSAHAAIIALRIKEPELHRPFKIPLNIRIRRREIPIPAVIGGLATGATWFIVLYTHHIGRIVGFAWLGVGLIIYIWYRKAIKQPIIKRAR